MRPPSGVAAQPPQPTEESRQRCGFHLLPPLLLLLALADLRTELRLLFDHFTLTSILTAISSHPLAVVVLLAQPSLWRRYHGGRR